MATLNKYIYDIRGLLRNRNYTNSDLLTDREIEFWIITQRSMWIRRRDRTFIHTDHSLMQTIIDTVISIDRSFIPTQVPVEYRILRTEHELPKMINFESWDGIISCGPVDMVAKRFNHTEYQEAVNSGYGRFNKGEIFSFVLDRYIYLISKSVDNYWKYISQLAAIGIWEDPRELALFKHQSGDACWTNDMDYPINLELWNFMKKEIEVMNLDPLVKIPVDKSNDDNNSNIDSP